MSVRNFIDSTKHMLEHINDPPAPTKGKCMGDGSLIKKAIAGGSKIPNSQFKFLVTAHPKPEKTGWNKTLYRSFIKDWHSTLGIMAIENGDGFDKESASIDMATDIITSDEKYHSPPSGYPSGIGHYLRGLGSQHPAETLADAFYSGN